MADSDSKQFGDQFLGKLSNQLDKKAPVFNQSLFAGAGGATKDAWNAGQGFGNSLVASNGYGPGQQAAQDSTGDVFSGYGGLVKNGGLTSTQGNALVGNRGLGSQYGALGTAYDPNAAAYKTLRQGVIDDTLSNLGSQFTASGRFGGGSYVDTASQGLGDALAGLDYNNMTADINNRYRALDSQSKIYGDTFNMGQTGRGNQLAGLGGQAATAGQQFGMGQTALGNRGTAIDQLTQIGAARDANQQGKLLGQADLFDRTKNAELDRLIKIGAAFGGDGPAAAANEAPWWQQGLGALLSLGGSAASGGAFNNVFK